MSTKSRILLVALAVSFSVLFGHYRPGLAQENVGQITGVVQDPSGAIVPNATVTASNVATGVQLEETSSAEGVYRFSSLPIGEYKITVRAAGFKTLERLGVHVVAAVILTLPLQLEVGKATESVTVSATAAQIDTTATTEGTTRVTEEINELPELLNGGNRNAIDFIKTLPGVQTPVLTDIQTTTINGAPEGGESLTIDGVMGSVTPYSALRVDFSPPPESIDEIRLNASDTSEFGGNSGVGVVLVTKSGTNQLHGDLFEYFRNKVLNARNWYAKDADPAKQNEYGFTLGGPVYFPKLYNGKDKTFFFVVYSGFRYLTTPQGLVLNVPTAKMRTGDFSELLPGTQLYDGLYGTVPDPAVPTGFSRPPFQGNIIPTNLLSKFSTFWQQSFPLPNRPGLAVNFVGAGASSPVSSEKGSFKIDQNFKDARQRITFAYDKFDSSSVDGGTYTGFISDGSVNVDNTWTSRLIFNDTLSPTMILSLRLGLNRNALNSSGLGPTPQSQDAATLAGYKGNFSTQMPQITLTDFGGWGPPSQGFSNSTDYTTPVNADLTLSKGEHNLKFGGSWYSSNSVLHSCDGCAGAAVFLPFFTSAFFGGNNPGGYGYADYLMGSPLYMAISSPTSEKFQTAALGLYAQDSWRVTKKLTANYGLRWDRFDNPHESYNRMSVMDPGIINTEAGGIIGAGPGNWPGALSFFGKGPGRNGLTSMAPPLNFLSPRLGLAYAVTPKTAVRASYGLSTSDMAGLMESGIALNGQPGYTWNPIVFFYHDQYGELPGPCQGIFSYVQCPYQWDSGGGFPLIEPPLPDLSPTQANGITPPYWHFQGLKSGYSENLNFGIERDFHGTLLKVAYVGNLAHRLPMQHSLNQMNPKYLAYGNIINDNWGDPDVIASGLTPPFPQIQGQVWRGLVPYPQFASVIDLAAAIGKSYYHSLQVSAQKHYGNGLSYLVSYTASKQLTNYSGFGGTGGAGALQSQSLYLDDQSTHLGNNDRPQNLTLSYVYELPFGPGKRFFNQKGVVGKLLEGWRVSGIDTYTSGTPIDIATTFFEPGFSPWPVWENKLPSRLSSCGSEGGNGPNQYLNPNAFVNPTTTYNSAGAVTSYGIGNVSTLPNVRGCPYYDEDLSLQRVVKIREHFDILFSGDVSNLFNRHSFVGMNSDITETAAFGQFSGATNPREVQLHAKIEF